MRWFLLLAAVLAQSLPDICMYQTKECGGHGKCQQINYEYTCICDEGYTLSPSMLCVPEACYNPQFNTLCQNGKCVEEGGSHHCECPSDLTAIGAQCVADDCISVIDGVQTACSGHGTCLYDGYSVYYCACEQHYVDYNLCATCNLNYGAIINGECYPLKCIQKTTQGDSVLCNNCGTCSFSATGMINARKWHCVCDDKCKAKDGQCLSNSCVSDNYETYCGNAGVCTPSGCLCNSGFSGDKCTHNDADPGACPPNQTRVDGTCYPDRCLTKTDPPMVCGIQGAGECLYFDLEDAFVCKCNDGALSTDVYPCIPTGCYVDNQMCPNGKCIAESSGSGYKYHCECDDGFITRNNSCLPPSCFVSLSDGSTLECSGHGTCRTFGCDCDYPFYGDYCENYSGSCGEGFLFVNPEVGCIAIECITYNPDLRVCGGFGKCVANTGFYECECEAGTVYDRNYICAPVDCIDENGEICPSSSCVKLADGTSTCACPQGYSTYHGHCYPTICITGSALCSGHGKCNQAEGKCICSTGYEGLQCEQQNDDQICPDGTASIDGKCISFACLEVDGVVTSIECNGHGRCRMDSSAPKCECDPNYTLSPTHGCVSTGCYDEANDMLCPGGTCEGEGATARCSCNSGFVTVDGLCVSEVCIGRGVKGAGNEVVCSSGGRCQLRLGGNPTASHDYYCMCDTAHHGSLCSECSSSAIMIGETCVDRHCVTEIEGGVLVQCGGFGRCHAGYGEVGLETTCECGSNAILIDGTCVVPECLGHGQEVCSGHGHCALAQHCVGGVCTEGRCYCDQAYDGSKCSSCVSGYQIVAGAGCVARSCVADGVVCSNAGTCHQGTCHCASGYRAAGPRCVGAGLSIGMLIGIGVACGVLIIAIGLTIYFVLKRVRSQRRGSIPAESHETPTEDENKELLGSETDTDEIP